MNFFGHATVAAWESREPRWVLGAMLPDFVSMCRARVAGIDDPAVAAGVAMHHRTDEVFHACPTFTALQRDGIEALEARGVGRGASRAVAHVGTELLIDGLLLEDGAACDAYLGAVELEGDLGLRFRRGGDRFADLRARVAGYGLPTDYRRPERVTSRLRRILADRPRLALAEGDDGPVTEWLLEARNELETRLDALLSEVRQGLRAVDMDASGRAILRRHQTPLSTGRESV